MATRRFKVTPDTAWRAFPIDMLRYDCCWPATERDSGLIAASLGENFRWTPGTTIEVEKDSARPVLTMGRWQSFGWRIAEGEDLAGDAPRARTKAKTKTTTKRR